MGAMLDLVFMVILLLFVRVIRTVFWIYDIDDNSDELDPVLTQGIWDLIVSVIYYGDSLSLEELPKRKRRGLKGILFPLCPFYKDTADDRITLESKRRSRKTNPPVLFFRRRCGPDGSGRKSIYCRDTCHCSNVITMLSSLTLWCLVRASHMIETLVVIPLAAVGVVRREIMHTRKMRRLQHFFYKFCKGGIIWKSPHYTNALPLFDVLRNGPQFVLQMVLQWITQRNIDEPVQKHRRVNRPKPKTRSRDNAPQLRNSREEPKAKNTYIDHEGHTLHPAEIGNRKRRWKEGLSPTLTDG